MLAVVANLWFLSACPPGAYSGLTLKLGKSANTARPARYREECERGQLPHVLSLMAHPEARLIVIKKGKRGATSRTATVINPGEEWVTFVLRTPPSLCDIGREAPREVIALKAPRSVDPRQRQRAATWLAYTDTTRTIAWRRQVERLNARLGAADLSLDLSALPSEAGQMVIDLGDRYVVRYFNNARWDHGGRLFGGFWQSMPSATRAALRIGGKPVAIADFASLFARLLYARCGLDVAPERDLYALPNYEAYREGIKKVMAALLFREGSLEKLPQGSRSLLPRGTKASAVEAAVRAAHPGIAAHLGRNIGFDLMHTESELLLAVLEGCAAAGIVALPLHDAVIVPASRAYDAKAIMERAYRAAIGMTPAVGIKRAGEALETPWGPEMAEEADAAAQRP